MNLENHEYEKALLGCIILDNRVLEELPISRNLFDNKDCQDVFDEIKRTISRKAIPTILELGLMRPDLASFIAELTSQVPSAANAKFYFDSLVDLSRRRGIAKLSREIAYKAVNDVQSESIFEYIDHALSEIADLKNDGYQKVKTFLPDVTDELEKLQANRGKLTGIETGFPLLDAKTNGWQKQEFIVIGARPGTGKTSIALNLCSAALRSGKTVGFFSAEMSARLILMRIISDWGAVNYSNMTRGTMTCTDMQGLKEAALRLMDASLFLNDAPSISLALLVSESRKMKRKENVDIIFVDYLSLISNERKDAPRHEQIAQISNTMKKLARELDIPIVVLSQLTRDAQGERPKLSQLRDSGAVEQDADIVILLQNQGLVEGSNDTKIKINLIVEKNRNGQVGDIPMVFTPSWMRFREQTYGS